MAEVEFREIPHPLKLARDVLAIPISTITSKSAFTTGGRVLDVFKSCLTLKIVEALICNSDWLRKGNQLVSIEEALEDLENFKKAIN